MKASIKILILILLALNSSLLFAQGATTAAAIRIMEAE